MELKSRVLQRLLPGIGIVFFLVLLPAVFSRPEGLLVDPAAGRHLAAGRWLLSQHAVLSQDPFSWTRPGAPWIDFEWLFEALAGTLERAGGLPLVVWGAFLCSALLPVLLWHHLMRHGISLLVAFILVISAVLLFGGHRSVRPYLFTYLFFQIVVALWRDRREPGLREWIALPGLMIVWANVHGGFMAGLLFLALSGIGRCWDDGDFVSLRLPWRRNWAALGVTSGLMTLVNPHGWQLHAKMMEMVFRMKSFAFWDEFTSPDFAAGSTLGLAVLVAIFTLIFFPMGSEKRGRWEIYLPVLIFIYFGLKSQRHIFLLVIAALLPVARRWQALLEKAGFQHGPGEMALYRGEIWLIPVLSVVLWFPFRVSEGVRHLRVGSANLTPESVFFVREHQPHWHRPLTTPWNAGALLYYLAPPFRVSFDDRTDFYGDAFNFRALRLLQVRPGWDAILQEDGYDAAILERGEPLAQMLPLLPGWHQVYADSLTIIFSRE